MDYFLQTVEFKEDKMLKGLFTALVTPFKKDGSVDEDAYRELIEKQIEA